MNDTEKWRNELLAELQYLRGRLSRRVSVHGHEQGWFPGKDDRYLELLENAGDLVQGVDAGGRFLYVNKKWLQTMGYDSAEVKGLRYTDVVRPDHIPHCSEVMEKLSRGEHIDDIRTVFVTKSGSDVFLEGNATPWMDGGLFAGSMGIFRDVTQRIAIERELQEHRVRLEELVEEKTAQFRTASRRLEQEIEARRKIQDLIFLAKEEWEQTFDAIRDAITIHDVNFTVLRANKAAERVLGRPMSEIVGRKCYQLYHGSDAPPEGCASCMTLKSGSPSTTEIYEPFLGKFLEIKAFPRLDGVNHIANIVHVSRDISIRKKMEEELLKTQKLESLGILASGIAHDFNNLLTTILGNVNMVRTVLNPGEESVGMLLEAEKASLRARDLVQQLLVFSRGGSMPKAVRYLKWLIRDSAQFALSGSNIRVVFSLDDDLWPVEVDEGQMSQVVHNLTLNAREAMPDGGVVRIRARNVYERGDLQPGLRPGRYVMVDVEDEGTGIAEEHLPRIFEPYYSTKEIGVHRGMGLGLAICHSIVRDHGGVITVSSSPGRGATFSFSIPASLKAVPQQEALERERKGSASGRILIMDDEETVRKTVGYLLEHVGYDVDLSKDGEEALRMYQDAAASGRPFDAVILDLTVRGGMGGEETIRRLLEIDPSAKAIVASGYTSSPVMARHREFGFLGVMPKPFRIEQLLNLLRDITEKKG